ncbi:MAG: hypothetical protein FD143_1520 [Ignavibacteria bacterium]|nr:MAG: hypothetical protein FD143_1520 [Ignavibacteria bacterium]KAF0161882.1 MAG: hypothetical protein FD188_476 [Ignavibacteria bacterium]
MALTKEQREKIKVLLVRKIENKLKKYGRETSAMPFLARLIQDNEKIASYSFLHSMATTLGMSIYEEVSVILCQPYTTEVFRNYGIGGVISKSQKIVINSIVNDLINTKGPSSISREIEHILKASSSGGTFQKSGNIAGLYFLKNGIEHYFEIKTVKPNNDVFEKSKSKLLEWVARKRKNIKVFLVFPYNPYHPEPYSRFTENGLMDYGNDFLVGKDYWNYIGGKNTFPQLLEVFDEVGKEFKARLRKKFKEIAKQKIDSY